LIYSGTRASTTGNMQLYSVIINRDSALKQKLVSLHFNQGAASTAPVLITFIADIHRFSLWCRYREADPGYDNFLTFLNAFTDALLVAQNVCIAAENAGLGICYLGTTLYNADKVIEVLDLPGLTFPVTTLAIGWPAENPVLTDRIPVRGIMHHETYQPYDSGAIDDLYREKEQLESSLKFCTENNRKTLAQVFTDIRYKKTDNEFFSDKIIQTLKKQGFLLPLL